MMRIMAFVLACAAALALCGCAADDGGDARGTTGGVLEGAGGTKESGGTRCFGLDYCGCIAEPDCRVVGEPCFCPCNAFPCSENCLCACGGGDYLGCAPADCPISDCPEGSTLIEGKDGCPICVPPTPCEKLDPCGCFAARDRCAYLADGCICECGDFVCPGVEPCDCACGGGTWLGCYDRSCPQRRCNEGESPAIGADGCPTCVGPN